MGLFSRDSLIGFPELMVAVGVRAVAVELALAFLDPELAKLGLVVVVGHTQHFVDDFFR